MDRKSLFREAFLERIGTSPSENVPLSAMSSFGIGGPADLFFEARTEGELEAAVSLAVAERYPFYVIGGGNNLLFDDSGYRGLIIRNRLEGVVLGEIRMSVLSGTGLPCVLREALGASLCGLEFLAGIPGTVGGAVYGNAGAYGWSIGEVLESATVLRPGGRRETLSREELGFGYRDSALKKTPGIVLSATLLCSPGDSRESEAKIRDILEKRRTKHPPLGTACAGSYFKNSCFRDRSEDRRRPAAPTGGRLRPRGRATRRSTRTTANFIINKGNARSSDVLALAAELKEKVYKMFGVRLEEEVIYLRADASML